MYNVCTMCTSCDFHVCPDWENAVLVLLTHRDRPTPLDLPWTFFFFLFGRSTLLLSNSPSVRYSNGVHSSNSSPLARSTPGPNRDPASASLVSSSAVDQSADGPRSSSLVTPNWRYTLSWLLAQGPGMFASRRLA